MVLAQQTVTMPAQRFRSGALAPVRDQLAGKEHQSSQYRTGKYGLEIAPGMDLDAWRDLGRRIHAVADSSIWWLGDWLVYGQNTFPGRYRAAVEATGLDYQTLRNYSWVCRSIPAERRHPYLSFHHHAEVAGLPPAIQTRLLERAGADRWSRNQLRLQVRRVKAIEAGEHVDEKVQVRVDLVQVQKERWQAAAERAETDLVKWMIEVLDQAATA